MSIVYIGLGSNLGEGQRNLLDAWEKMAALPETKLRQLSSPYFTEPVGLETENWFTNAVGVIETDLSPIDLLRKLLNIEKFFGRDRKKTGDRPLDLDILFYNDHVLDEHGLVVPHPAIQERMFVLAPLDELSPDYIHPALGLTVSEMKCRLTMKEEQEQSGLSVKKKSWNEKLLHVKNDKAAFKGEVI